MKKLILVLLMLLLVMPVAAQDDAETLPAGCNIGALSDILLSYGQGLAEAQEQIDPELAISILAELEDAILVTQAACSEELVALAEANRIITIDYAELPQSRTEDGGFVLGYEDAPITIVEFADFICPHCQTFHGTMNQIIAEYVVTGQARFEYRMYPVVDPNRSALSAVMVECAEILQPGSFWEAYDVMYQMAAEGFGQLTPYNFVTQLGLDFDAVAECVNTANQIQTDYELGQSLGVTGTPSIRVRYNNGEIEGIENYRSGALSYDAIVSLIENAQDAEASTDVEAEATEEVEVTEDAEATEEAGE
jgi:protein-disulfide isomerase